MNTSPRTRHGFTLVELLVVITIIGILAGLITAAAFRARIAAKQAVIKIEMEQLAMALEKYKNEVGEYPPDFVFLNPTGHDDHINGTIQGNAQQDILRHLRKAFPRYRPLGDPSNPSQPEWDRFCYDIRVTSGYTIHNPINNTDEAIDPNRFDPATALLFFLGGLPEQATGEWIPAGFHSDPAFPFKPNGPRTKPYFEFKREQIKVVEPHPDHTATANRVRYLRYYPVGLETPYIYFKCRSKEYGTTNSPPTQVYPSRYTHSNTTKANRCVAYLEPPSNEPDPTNWDPNLPTPPYPRLWRSPGKFQLITAGLDNEFGEGNVFRYSKAGIQVNLAGTEYEALNAGNLDNLTNFTEGTLEDEM